MGELAQQQAPTWAQVIDKVAPQFNEIATRHKLVTWAEESQFANQAIQKNDKLAGCAVHTVQNAIINVAAVGLTLNPALGYAYLVPESVKQANGKYMSECMLRVSFKGLLKIATDSGSIKWAKAEIVKEKDTFTYHGPCQMPEHSMNPFGDRGNTVGVYCIAKTHDGDVLVDVMSKAEIDKVKAAAKTHAVWNTWEDEMAKKAIIKRGSKQWPKTDRDDRLDRAIAVVNEYEGGETIEHGPVAREPAKIEAINDEQADKLRKAIEMAGWTEEVFCSHKSVQIPQLEALPAARYEGAVKFLQARAQGGEQ
jgi:recombination protein RecT